MIGIQALETLISMGTADLSSSEVLDELCLIKALERETRRLCAGCLGQLWSLAVLGSLLIPCQCRAMALQPACCCEGCWSMGISCSMEVEHGAGQAPLQQR